MKKYAITIDVSPSEQIGNDDDTIFALGILLGLKSPKSFDMVGAQFPDQGKQLQLRKYSKASQQYKKELEAHLVAIKNSGHAMTGASIVDQRFIKNVGLKVWTKAHGSIPAPSSYSKKGKPRILLGGYPVDGIIKPPFEVLEDELAIIGWLTMEIASVQGMLCKINEDIVKLDVLIDRLPTEKGDAGTNKAELLKSTLDHCALPDVRGGQHGQAHPDGVQGKIPGIGRATRPQEGHRGHCT